MGNFRDFDYNLLSDQLINDVSLLMVAFDEDLNLVCWNAKAREVTGFSFEEAEKSRLPLSFRSHIKQKKPTYKEVSVFPISFRDQCGEIHRVRFRLDKIKDKKGQKALYLFTGFDCTKEQKLKEKLVKKNKHLRMVNRRLKDFVALDSHTGVLNYRHLMSSLNSAFCNSLEKNLPITFLLVSLDYFYSINIAHGLAGGNHILAETAKIISENIGSDAFVGRFSGTEFAIVFPRVDVNTAFKRAQKLYTTITDKDFYVDGNTQAVSLSVHMALGGVPHCEDVHTSEQLVSRVADKLKNGRKVGISSPIFMCAPKPSDLEYRGSRYFGSTNCEDYRYTIEFVNALANTVKTKDRYTKEHSRIMSNYAVCIAKHLGMGEREIRNVKYGSVLHDIGKIGIDKMILLKKGSLSPEEFEVIKQHPRIGAEIIRNVHPLKEVVPLMLYHHERYDGTGYLEGLAGEKIPLGARIISLADVFQALTSNRPYRRALTDEEAFKIIREYSGAYFDPGVVDAFFKIYHPA